MLLKLHVMSVEAHPSKTDIKCFLLSFLQLLLLQDSLLPPVLLLSWQKLIRQQLPLQAFMYSRDAPKPLQVNVLPHTRRSTCSVRSAGFSARPVNGQTGAMHDLLPHLPGKGFRASSGKSHILSVQLIFGHVAPQQLLLQLQHGVLLHGQALLQSILMRGRERRVH